MITYLRKIRKYLIEQKKIRNYIVYAIGEIFLIVLGIIIALQINNWNVNRIQHNKEVAYINEIQKSMLSDLERIEEVFNYNSKKDSCINEFITIIGNQEIHKVDIKELVDLLNIMGRYEEFNPNYVAFNTMVSAESINLIQSNSLRIALATYYGKETDYVFGTQARVKNKTREFVDVVVPMLLNKEMASYLTGIELEYGFPDISENEFHENPDVFYEMLMMKINIVDQNLKLEKAKTEIESILMIIAKLDI